MSFQPGQSGNPAGRPPGAKTRVAIPKEAQRTVIKGLVERAKSGDSAAVDTLALLMLQGVGNGR